MSLLKWATPERCRDDKILPVIPNEIYLHLFEFIAPSDECLPPEELKTFHRLSHVCKFFANVCLPRVFESLEVSSFASPAHRYKASLASMLYTQISEKQPLALALAETVRACHFTNPTLARTEDSWSIDAFTFKEYISATILMKNIRELLFSNYVVETEHWSMIAALPSLTDLSLHSCDFEEPRAEDETKLKISRLSVSDCNWDLLSLKAADMECLRKLTVEFATLDEIWFHDAENWLLESAITELHLHVSEEAVLNDMDLSLDYALKRMPRSLEVLCFLVEWSDEYEWLDEDEDASGVLYDFVDMLYTLESLSSLSSLTVRVVDGTLVTDELSRSINRMDLRICEIHAEKADRVCFPSLHGASDNLPDVRRILHDQFGPASGHDTNLKHVYFFGTVFRLVDGVWSEGA